MKHDHSESTPHSARAAPTSTTVMTLQEMIQEVGRYVVLLSKLPHRYKQFDLSALTHRRTILDPSKLEHLNKNHLMETWSQPDGLNALANRVIGSVKEAFPDR